MNEYKVGPKVNKLNMILTYLNYQPNILFQLVKMIKKGAGITYFLNGKIYRHLELIP